MRKYKGFILRISKLLLINLFFGIGIHLIICYTPLAKLADTYLVILAIILPFVFKANVMMRKNSLFAEYNEIFDKNYKAFNKTLMKILLVEYIVIMYFVFVLNNILGLYDSDYEEWKYEGIWFFAINMFVAILFCGSMKNKISSEELEDYDNKYEYIEDNKLIIKKKTKRIVRNAIIAAVVLGVTYFKVIDSRLDFIFDELTWTKTEKEIVEYFEKDYNIQFELEKTTYDKNKHEYTHILKTRDNRTFEVKQVPEKDRGLTLFSFHYKLEYSLDDMYEDELKQIEHDLCKIIEKKNTEYLSCRWEINSKRNFYEIDISSRDYDDAEKLVAHIMEVVEYCRENRELFCMCNDVYINVTGVNLKNLVFRVEKDKLIHTTDDVLFEHYSTMEEKGLEIKDNKQLEEFLKFKNYMFHLEENKYSSIIKKIYSDKEYQMFQSNQKKYVELYGE